MWRGLTADAEAERKTLEARIRQHFGGVRDADLFGGTVLNLDSDQDLKAALHALGHAVPDVRRETVAALPPPLGDELSRYRELFKIVSAYGDSFLAHVAKDGRVHPIFEQIGASTGRMACHSPNLQAVVKGTPHRGCFHTAPGRRLVIGDYSACELRILAEMSGDPVFAEAFGRGEDLHARVASEVFGKKVSKTENPDLRERAKAINFGLAYGMGAGGLARATGSSVTQAKDLLERYFKTFPRIRAFLEHSAADALARGYARTMTGRRLYLDVGEDREARGQAERIAKNMPIQGTSADITKIALARLRRRLVSFHDAAIVNTVHDEVVVECDEVEADPVKDALGDEMRQAGAEVLHTIPVGVDVTVSTKWDK
jgi:DNA polymerase-1